MSESNSLIDEATTKKALVLLNQYSSWLKLSKRPYVVDIVCKGSDAGTSVVVGYEGTETLSKHIKEEAKLIAEKLALELKEMGFKP